MLQTFYNNFGFVGALALAFLLFLSFIFWIAGIAGLCMEHDSLKTKDKLLILLAVLLPPYPILWMILEVYTQNRLLRKSR